MAFDVITPVKMGRGEIAVDPTVTTFRTTPASSVDFVKTIDIANNAAVSATVSVYLVPSGGSPDNTNILMPDVSIPANTIMQWSGVQILDAAGTIQAMSSVADVALHVSGGNAV